jgi:hypothetical protein
VKEQPVHFISRSRQASGVPSWGPTPGWGQPLPGWQPLVDHGPLPLRAAGSVARWWWPTLAAAGFLAVVSYVTGHDHPSLSNRGLLTITLAAAVVVLLTLHRRAGPGALARAAAEYSAVALLAGLLALAGGVDQPPASHRTETKHPATANQAVEARDHRPGVVRIAAGVIRAISRAIRAVTGAVGWLVDLWRQADAKTDRGGDSPATTPKGEAMAPSPALTASTRRLL